MKKLIAILAVCALTAISFADTVTISHTGDGTATMGIDYATTGTVPVGVSMMAIVTGDLSISSADGGSDNQHEVYIDWAYTNGTSTLDANGEDTSGNAHPVAQVASAGELSLPTTAGASFALCMGELAGTPAAAGTLAEITFTGTAGTVQLAADTGNRGGIVDQNGDAMTVVFPGVWTFGGGVPCMGDVDGNGFINPGDSSALNTWLVNNTSPPFYSIATPGDKVGWDMDGNGFLNPGDSSAINTWLVNNCAPPFYSCPCP